MPKIITMPTTPFFASSTFVLTRAIAQSVSPFTGKTRTQEFDTASWSSSVVLPAMRRDSAAAWQSFLLNAKGPTTNDPVQLVMAVEDATLTTNGGDDHYSVAIQPKLRADLTNSHLVGFSSPHNQSRFRLTGNVVEWSANSANTYTGISFDVTEVI